MIIGNGQLAKAFKGKDTDDTVVFASGVSNSKCVDNEQFLKERELLIEHLEGLGSRNIVYFSSCAISANDYPLNDYYQHKISMEELIKSYTDNYYIFRIPQLFGKVKEHPTLINYIFKSIKNEEDFTVYSRAYRYVIEISDAVHIVSEYIKVRPRSTIIDISNPYKYNILEIVSVIEYILNKKAIFKEIDIDDQYTLDLCEMNVFLDSYNIKVDFGQDYLLKKLSENIQCNK